MQRQVVANHGLQKMITVELNLADVPAWGLSGNLWPCMMQLMSIYHAEGMYMHTR